MPALMSVSNAPIKATKCVRAERACDSFPSGLLRQHQPHDFTRDPVLKIRERLCEAGRTEEVEEGRALGDPTPPGSIPEEADAGAGAQPAP